jgi:hypothetical protein
VFKPALVLQPLSTDVFGLIRYEASDNGGNISGDNSVASKSRRTVVMDKVPLD